MNIVKPLLDQMKRSKTDKEDQDYFSLGHMIKYNVYLVSKAIIFASLVSKFSDEELTDEDLLKFAEKTESAMKEIDLASKKN